jgi:hypothetical protein
LNGFGAPLIRPEDDAWFVDGAEFWIVAQAAVGNDCCVFAAALHDEAHDYFDPDWPYCRFSSTRAAPGPARK